MSFTLLEPAAAKSTSRMKWMRQQRVQVIDHPIIDAHHTAAGYSQIDFSDGWSRGNLSTFWADSAEFAKTLGGV